MSDSTEIGTVNFGPQIGDQRSASRAQDVTELRCLNCGHRMEFVGPVGATFAMPEACAACGAPI